ncbi:MAG: chemotaxis protein CheW [Candidatus Omnitrophica bacterium]|nr:chemotaxis protein CheW [Candidatus Omnitrophota bacterium]
MDKNIATRKNTEMLSQSAQKRQAYNAEEKIIQLIVFHLGDEEFGADIAQVREIIRKGSVTPIPDSPDFIEGVSNVRGEIAVVIDLKRRFFLDEKKHIEERHIIMTELDKNLFGLIVDEVTEVLRIHEQEIMITPEIVTRIDKAYISGVLTIDERLIIMLDLKKVLSEEELEKLSEISAKHRHAIEKEEEEKAMAKETKNEEHADKKTADGVGKSPASVKSAGINKRKDRG